MALLQNARQETLIETQAKVSSQIARDVEHVHQFLIARYNHIMKTFWKHPRLTPQQVSDSLGTEAVELFLLGGKLTEMIISITPESASELEVPLYPYTINEDGSVTIPEPIEEEEPEPEIVDDPVVIPDEEV